jgi:hypothetical protein
MNKHISGQLSGRLPVLMESIILTHGKGYNAKAWRGNSRNQRSADSLVRVLVCGGIGFADKAVRAPRKFAQMNKTFTDSSTKTSTSA